MASTAVALGESAAPGWTVRAAAPIEEWLEAERHSLVLWLPVALGSGMAAWFLLPAPGQWIAFAATAVAIAILGLLAGGWSGRVLLVGGLLAALGLGLAWARAEAVAAPRLDRERVAMRFEARVLAVEDRAGREQWRLFLAPDDRSLPPKVRISLRDPPPPGTAPGARVAIRATLRPPPGPSVPGGYDFARRAWFEGTGAIGYALGRPTLLAAAQVPSGARARLDDARTRLTKRLQTAIGGTEGAIAAAFVTGDEGGIPQPVAQQWRDAGIAHLLSISGLHIAVVIAVTMIGVRRLLTLSPWIALRWPVKAIAAAAAAIAGIGYTLLAGAEVPTVRSVAAALVVLVGIVAGRQAITLRTIAAGAFVILLFRPEALIGPSFQLSFAAVTGLVAAYQSPPGRRLFLPRDDEGWLRRKGRWLVGLMVSGVVAEAMLAPTALYHFNREGLYGMVANLIAIPLAEFLVMPALMLALLFDLVGLAAPAFWAVRLTMGALVDLAQWVAGWPGAVMRAPTMPLAAYAAFVGGGLWLCLLETRVRLFGFAGVALGIMIAAGARPPDLLVSGDGRHMGVLRRDGALALLRPRAGDFIRDMWGDAMGTGATLPLDAVAAASCGIDACVVRLARGGREWRILATRSRRLVPRREFMAACAAADIVVSERRLPPWCAPRWLKLDRTQLGRTGAVALWLAEARVETATGGQGAHPWAAQTPPPIDYSARRKSEAVPRRS